jgi:hypothetical protein
MYTIYHDGGDTEVFERPDGTRDKNEFVFKGFSNSIHPYHKKKTQWAVEMLKSANVNMFIQEVPTVADMCSDPYSGEMEIGDLLISAVPVKEGMRNMLLFQDTEMGRGWAVLLEIDANAAMTILKQEHRDTVRDQTLLDAKWLKKQGVTLKRKKVKDIDKIKLK